MTPGRTDAIERFLNDAGWQRAQRQAIAGDASGRRFERLAAPAGGSVVLMDAGDDVAGTCAWLAVGARLASLGVRVPSVFRADAAAGLVLMEDFGDDTFARLLVRGCDAGALLNRGVDLLLQLHRGVRAAPGGTADLPAFDADRFLDQLDLFCDVAVPAARGRPLDADERAGFRDAWAAVLPAAFAVPETVLLRDFHAGNLMALPGGDGATGVIDFQDAGRGPITYDLVSLLQDARRDYAPDQVRRALARYAGEAGVRGPDFMVSYVVMGAVRHTRILAVFQRLAAAGRPAYLAHLPRVRRHLAVQLSQPALEPVADWLERHLPGFRAA